MSSKHTTDAVKILKARYFNTPKRLKDLEKARQEADIAARIYELRQQAKLSQKQLAELIGTTQSVISRLEDADYKGHSLEMLRRIAAALHCKLQVRIVPENKRAYAF
jgi:ribosome-binding protein aMBF1 (putative translation factor)